MADFDTAAKRYSGMGMAGYGAPLLPIPDGTLSSGDRYQLLDLYSGATGGGATFQVAWATYVNTILGAGNP